MSIKSYGIYMTYAPTVDLRAEGLGRYIANLIKGGLENNNVKFIIACPYWSRKSILELLEAEKIDFTKVEIISTPDNPIALKIFQFLSLIREKRIRKVSFKSKLKDRLQKVASFFSQKFVQVSGISGWLYLLVLIGMGIIMLPFFLICFVLYMLFLGGKKIAHFLKIPTIYQLIRAKISNILTFPKEAISIIDLYQYMIDYESRRLIDMVNDRKDIRAWYIPTSYWPHSIKLHAPRLMCVPDIVITDFPVGFSITHDARLLDTLSKIKLSLDRTKHFITYSENTKWSTLVGDFGVNANNIFVSSHGVNNLSAYINIEGANDREGKLTEDYARIILTLAITKASGGYSQNFLNRDVKFLFYASQCRPNKNILTLLRAYNFLLKKQIITHKLFLTGNPKVIPEISKYVSDNNLENDVLFLHGLSITELASCYYLADLAVNPSLSEGGCPFTFSEALSVDTPVIMSDIVVSREVLTDKLLQDVTFFDPYDYKGLSDKIVWALDNREYLLSIQKTFYQELAKRTWKDVATEHIKALEKIASEHELNA